MIAAHANNIEDVFSRLSPRDGELLVSLPYRVGLFVSHSDTTGGWEAQEREMQSLTNILREFTEDYCKSELAQKVLLESMRQRSNWPQWSQKIEDVPKEAQQMMAILKPLFLEKQLSSFREVLVDIAMSVAMAFREEQGANMGGNKPSIFNELLGFLSRAPADPLAHMNISIHERAALSRLCKAIGHTAAR